MFKCVTYKCTFNMQENSFWIIIARMPIRLAEPHGSFTHTQTVLVNSYNWLHEISSNGYYNYILFQCYLCFPCRIGSPQLSGPDCFSLTWRVFGKSARYLSTSIKSTQVLKFNHTHIPCAITIFALCRDNSLLIPVKTSTTWKTI